MKKALIGGIIIIVCCGAAIGGGVYYANRTQRNKNQVLLLKKDINDVNVKGATNELTLLEKNEAIANNKVNIFESDINAEKPFEGSISSIKIALEQGNINTANTLIVQLEDRNLPVAIKNEISKLKNQYKNELEVVNNFNEKFKEALSQINEDNNIIAAKNILDKIDTEGLPESDIIKLKGLKGSLPEMKKVCEVSKYINDGSFKEAQSMFKTINKQELIQNGVLKQSNFNELEEEIDKGLGNSVTSLNNNSNGIEIKGTSIIINGKRYKEPTVGYIREQITEKLGWKTTVLNQQQYNIYTKGTTQEKINLSGEPGIENKTFLNFGTVKFNTPNSDLAGTPDYIINGEPAYYVNAIQAAQLDGGNMHTDTLIGFNGHIYTEHEIYNSMKNRTFLQKMSLNQYTVLNLNEYSETGFGNSGSGGYFSNSSGTSNWNWPV